MRRLLLILALALTASCGHNDDPGVPTARAGSAAAPSAGASDPAAVTRCLRAHGWPVPDPQPGQTQVPMPANATQKDAFKACRNLIPGVRPDVPTAAELEQLRAFAVCIRSHDIPIDDPTPNEPGGGKMAVHGRFEHMSRAQFEADPGWKTALDACRNRLPADWLNPKKGSK